MWLDYGVFGVYAFRSVVVHATLAECIPLCKRSSRGLPSGGLLLYAVRMEGNICLVCGDPIKHLIWRQLALDASHDVRYTAADCGCGYKLIAVVVVQSVDA